MFVHELEAHDVSEEGDVFAEFFIIQTKPLAFYVVLFAQQNIDACRWTTFLDFASQVHFGEDGFGVMPLAPRVFLAEGEPENVIYVRCDTAHQIKGRCADLFEVCRGQEFGDVDGA